MRSRANKEKTKITLVSKPESPTGPRAHAWAADDS